MISISICVAQKHDLVLIASLLLKIIGYVSRAILADAVACGLPGILLVNL